MRLWMLLSLLEFRVEESQRLCAPISPPRPPTPLAPPAPPAPEAKHVLCKT